MENSDEDSNTQSEPTFNNQDLVSPLGNSTNSSGFDPQSITNNTTTPIINGSVPSPTESSPSNPYSHKHKSKNIMLVVLIIVIVVLVGIGAYFIGKHTSNSKSLSNVTKTSTGSSGSANLSGPYAGWYTFVDSSRVFSIKYPSNWVEFNVFGSGLGPTSLVDQTGANFSPNLFSNIKVNCFAYYGSLQSIFNQNVQNNGSPVTINSYPGLYYQQVSTGGQVSSTTDYYGVYHNGVTLIYSFSVLQSNGGPGDPAYNLTSEIPTFLKIINSTTFSVPASLQNSTYVAINSKTTYLKISQLGIKIPLTSSLNGLYYAWQPSTSTAWIFSPSLESLAHQLSPQQCAANPITSSMVKNVNQDNFIVLAMVNKGVVGPELQFNDVKLGNSYFDLESADFGCTNNNTVFNLFHNLATDLSKSFSQISNI